MVGSPRAKLGSTLTLRREDSHVALAQDAALARQGAGGVRSSVSYHVLGTSPPSYGMTLLL